jgi:hypothetical protein
MRKQEWSLIRAGLVLATLTLSGCAHPYVGTYAKETLPEHRLELKKNGTFSLVEAQKFEGKYSVNGLTITMTTKDGVTATGIISSNLLVDSHGGKWFKQTAPTP